MPISHRKTAEYGWALGVRLINTTIIPMGLCCAFRFSEPEVGPKFTPQENGLAAKGLADLYRPLSAPLKQLAAIGEK